MDLALSSLTLWNRRLIRFVDEIDRLMMKYDGFIDGELDFIPLIIRPKAGINDDINTA